jgi:predicted nucleic acid-binding protein
VTTRSGSELYLVDSSGWLEYLTEDSKAAAFGHYLEGEAAVLVPSAVIYEVYRHLAKQRGRTLADRFASQVLMRKVVPMDETIALAAANLSLDHRLAGLDAIVYATARVCQAQLVTADTHFRGLPGVIIP